ncbi:FkbM family methyltransferase [Leptolyngbyaceae cyanobacterium UHCC 1019]
MESSSYTTSYWQYLQRGSLEQTQATTAHVDKMLEATDWEEPQSALDLNNYAVVALIEAENSLDRVTRDMYLEMAIAALSEGAASHPLCAAHLAIIQSLLGVGDEAIQRSFSSFMNGLQSFHTHDPSPSGLVYLPLQWYSQPKAHHELLSDLLNPSHSDDQSLLLLAEILQQVQFVFYNAVGLRFLQLAIALFPQSAFLQHKLGISSLMNSRWEGTLFLHRAQQQQPNNPLFLQALYLAYRDLEQPEQASYWKEAAQIVELSDAKPEWQWITLSSSSHFTYVPFEQTLALAVEPSFRSVVTGVLLAEGDWFEAEMEFWRDQAQPGMTVIDVGANVGVYTFSAAQRVSATGRVLAVEPFSGCVDCLAETRRVNQLDWVTVCRGAASDRDGTAHLALHSASEMNQVMTEADASEIATEAVPCFTLDTLMEREGLQRVDLLKIDAEGHELQVLKGSDRLLKTYAPIILYENIAGSQGSNLPVAEFLIENGYQLFRYQPFVKQLIPLDSLSELQGNLNIIAIPA